MTTQLTMRTHGPMTPLTTRHLRFFQDLRVTCHLPSLTRLFFQYRTKKVTRLILAVTKHEQTL